MVKWPFFLLLFSFTVLAKELRPVVPKGWIEINSSGPVILTWVKANPDQRLEDLPTLMVQEFVRSPKVDALIKKYPGQDCFDVKHEDWDQIWCANDFTVRVILSRGQAQGLDQMKSTLKVWIRSYD